MDLMDGRYRINPLEPKAWSVDEEEDAEAPDTFRQRTLLITASHTAPQCGSGMRFCGSFHGFAPPFRGLCLPSLFGLCNQIRYEESKNCRGCRSFQVSEVPSNPFLSHIWRLSIAEQYTSQSVVDDTVLWLFMIMEVSKCPTSISQKNKNAKLTR